MNREMGIAIKTMTLSEIQKKNRERSKEILNEIGFVHEERIFVYERLNVAIDIVDDTLDLLIMIEK